MGIFDKKEKSSHTSAKEPDMQYKLFPISKPYGYSPDHVNRAIEQYQQTIEEQKKLIYKYKEALLNAKAENEKLNQTITKLNFEMNTFQVPNVNDIQEEYIREKFDKAFHLNDKKPKKNKEVQEQQEKVQNQPVQQHQQPTMHQQQMQMQPQPVVMQPQQNILPQQQIPMQQQQYIQQPVVQQPNNEVSLDNFKLDNVVPDSTTTDMFDSVESDLIIEDFDFSGLVQPEQPLQNSEKSSQSVSGNGNSSDSDSFLKNFGF